MQRQSYQVKTVLEKKGASKKTFLALKDSLGNPLSRSPVAENDLLNIKCCSDGSLQLSPNLIIAVGHRENFPHVPKSNCRLFPSNQPIYLLITFFTNMLLVHHNPHKSAFIMFMQHSGNRFVGGRKLRNPHK